MRQIKDYNYIGNCISLRPEIVKNCLIDSVDISQDVKQFNLGIRLAKRFINKEIADNFQRIYKNKNYIILIDSGIEFIFETIK